MLMTPYGSNNKYGAIKTMYNGAKYDSKKEAEYAKILDDLLDRGEIAGWKRQVRFPLPDLNWLETGSTKSWYGADFVVSTLDGRECIVEVKGVLTDANKAKYSLFQYYYKRKIYIVRTTGTEKMNTNWLTYKEE